MIFIAASVSAQAPNKMSYQAVIRNSSNALVTNIAVGIQISILQGSASGTAVYVETQTPTSNANGLVSLEIGNGTVVTGNFAIINWANGPYFIKTNTDPTGGTSYTITGTSQLLSVPYALHSKTAESVTGGILETDPIFGKSLVKNITAADIANWNLDNDDKNELQQLSVSTKGDTLRLQNGGFVIIPGISAANTVVPSYPVGTVNCSGTPTAIVDVTNPTTGKTWMDRNLGASQVATSSTDANSYGDLYQWGRGADGHQCRNSATTSTLSSTDQPGHGNFILGGSDPYDWRSPQNGNLWQGVNGINNPCPTGYRLPTGTEWEIEVISWGGNTKAAGALASPLKLPLAGWRNNSSGWIFSAGADGRYWSSSVSSTYSPFSRFLTFDSSGAGMNANNIAYGFSARCIKN